CLTNVHALRCRPIFLTPVAARPSMSPPGRASRTWCLSSWEAGLTRMLETVMD
ncbi:AKT1, partial [Symbiodinium sp. CCMP2456]